MNDPHNNHAVISEELWRTWAQLGKRRDEATARKRYRHAGLIVALFAIGVFSYFLAVR
jgi:hypothetical protein